MAQAMEHFGTVVRHRRALWYLGLGLMLFAGLAAVTVWGVRQQSGLSTTTTSREIWVLLVALWMVIGPSGLFILMDFRLSWVEVGPDYLRTRNFWQVRATELDRVGQVQVTRVGFRLRDVDGKVLTEVPYVTAGYDALLKQMVGRPGVQVERIW